MLKGAFSMGIRRLRGDREVLRYAVPDIKAAVGDFVCKARPGLRAAAVPGRGVQIRQPSGQVSDCARMSCAHL